MRKIVLCFADSTKVVVEDLHHKFSRSESQDMLHWFPLVITALRTGSLFSICTNALIGVSVPFDVVVLV